MAERALTPATVPKTYAELRRAVELTMVQGQRAIDQAKVRTYWETGWLIKEHVLLFKERADHGAGTIRRLAADIKVHRSVLQRCVQFAQAIPNCATWRNLAWAHFRELLPIADARQRKALATEANRNEWSVAELIQRIRALAPVAAIEASAIPTGEAKQLLKPQRGTPGVYRVALVGGALVVDLGFACYFDLSEEQAATVKEGDLVQLDGNGRLSAADGATKADLFNYRVELIKVVDGDTLWVKIYLRPRHWLKQKLRLRGLDCPEIKTPEGKAAKRFVDALVAKTTAITINTTKSDKYDRYLADVFLTTDSGEIFLNNSLLENAQAMRKDAWEFGDWEPDLVG